MPENIHRTIFHEKMIKKSIQTRQWIGKMFLVYDQVNLDFYHDLSHWGKFLNRTECRATKNRWIMKKDWVFLLQVEF